MTGKRLGWIDAEGAPPHGDNCQETHSGHAPVRDQLRWRFLIRTVGETLLANHQAGTVYHPDIPPACRST